MVKKKRKRRKQSRFKKLPSKYNAILLPALQATRKTGSEPLKELDQPFGSSTLLDFWRWSASDLLSNAMRGVFAEFLVANILRIDVSGVREDWAKYDLTTRAGLKMEVKSAAYLQSWDQYEYSAISFDVAPRYQFSEQGLPLPIQPERVADVYVLALLHHKIKHPEEGERGVDPLDVSQWSFFVLDRHLLDHRTRSQHSITEASLKDLDCGPYNYARLREVIEGYDSAYASNSCVI